MKLIELETEKKNNEAKLYETNETLKTLELKI